MNLFKKLFTNYFKKPEAKEFTTTVTDEDLANAIEDEHGAKYSPDGKRLLRGLDIATYEIKAGTEVISDNAFYGCSSLREINIPDSVTSIGSSAFCGCSSLEQINIPDSVTSIGSGAFCGCTSLRGINIPGSVTSIETITFSGCTSLQEITIPSSVRTIGANPFVSCTCTITCHSPHFKVVGNVLYDSDLTRLISFLSGQTDFTIPGSVTSIGFFAFFGCKSLREINIPDSVTSIEDGAFCGCSSLREINIPDSVTSIGDSAFKGCKSLQTILIPRGSREKFERLLPDDKDKLVVYIVIATDEGLTKAIEDEHGAKYSPDGKRLLRGADIKAYAIKDGTEVICDNAFKDCKSLRQIYIPNSVTSIGGIAFNGCTSLRQIYIPDSVTSIGPLAFRGCKSLQEITIPSFVRTIGANPFAGCTCTITCHSPHFKVVGNVLYNSDLTRLISFLSEQTDFTIPGSVTNIGRSAFSGCTSLREIYIPDSVTSIGVGAFIICESLQTILIPRGSRGKFERLLPDDKDKLVEAGD